MKTSKVTHCFVFALALYVLVPLAFTRAAQKTRTYKISAAQSNLWVFVEKGGFFSALAHNHNIGVRSFTGSVTVPESGAAGGAVQLDIDAKSLFVADKEVSEKDRTTIATAMHGEVLHSEKHARIAFKSVGVSEVKALGNDRYSLTVNGDLTLHGVTKRIAVPLAAMITPQRLNASGQYRLKQTNWGIAPYSKAGGAVKVKDDVVVHFNFVAQP